MLGRNSNVVTRPSLARAASHLDMPCSEGIFLKVTLYRFSAALDLALHTFCQINLNTGLIKVFSGVKRIRTVSAGKMSAASIR